MFDHFDSDKNNSLDMSELTAGFQSVGANFSEEQINQMLEVFDEDQNGSICLDEFYNILNNDTTVLASNPEMMKRAQVVNKTNDWVKAVTGYKSSHMVSSIFSPDAVLLGTVSRTIRTQDQGGVFGIKEYFDYFAKLPSSEVVRREDNIVLVTDDVFVNNAMVYWAWEDGPTRDEPLCARMTFVYRYNEELGDVELFQLHSSALPAPKID